MEARNGGERVERVKETCKWRLAPWESVKDVRPCNMRRLLKVITSPGCILKRTCGTCRTLPTSLHAGSRAHHVAPRLKIQGAHARHAQGPRMRNARIRAYGEGPRPVQVRAQSNARTPGVRIRARARYTHRHAQSCTCECTRACTGVRAHTRRQNREHGTLSAAHYHAPPRPAPPRPAGMVLATNR